MIFLEQGALDRLAAYVPRPALVVMDVNTEAVAGARVARELDADVLRLPADLHATEDAAAQVRARLRTGLVAVGSGTLTDIVRYAAHSAGCDFVSVPTAASMDGYASSVAAMERDGVKLTLPARAPAAIFADPRIAAAAPTELTRAGIGDLLAKSTARVDWLAAHLLYGEDWRALEPLPELDVAALLAGDVDAAAGLLRALIDSGLVMAAVGSSRPASGCEHHASHFWDLLAGRGAAAAGAARAAGRLRDWVRDAPAAVRVRRRRGAPAPAETGCRAARRGCAARGSASRRRTSSRLWPRSSA